MDLDALSHEYERLDEKFPTGETKEELIKKLKFYQRRRSLICWHDGSSISNHGHLLITFSTIYDKALFHTNEEYFTISGKNSLFHS